MFYEQDTKLVKIFSSLITEDVIQFSMTGKKLLSHSLHRNVVGDLSET